MNILSYSLHSQAVAGDEAHTLSVVSQTLANRRRTLSFIASFRENAVCVNRFLCLCWGNWYKNQSWRLWPDPSNLFKTQSVVVYFSWPGYQITIKFLSFPPSQSLTILTIKTPFERKKTKYPLWYLNPVFLILPTADLENNVLIPLSNFFCSQRVTKKSHASICNFWGAPHLYQKIYRSPEFIKF